MQRCNTAIKIPAHGHSTVSMTASYCFHSFVSIKFKQLTLLTPPWIWWKWKNLWYKTKQWLEIKFPLYFLFLLKKMWNDWRFEIKMNLSNITCLDANFFFNTKTLIKIHFYFHSDALNASISRIGWIFSF